MDAYIEMRADGDLRQEMYRAKLGKLKPKIQRLQEEIDSLSIEKEPNEVKDYTEKLTILQYALEWYTNRDEGQDVPKSVIEAFVVNIVVSKDGFDWYLRFAGDPGKPLHCQLQGKRKTDSKFMVSGDIFPTMDNSRTGRPESLVAYSRFDYSGCRLYTTWFYRPVVRPRNELVQEIDTFQNALFDLRSWKIYTLWSICVTLQNLLTIRQSIICTPKRNISTYRAG